MTSGLVSKTTTESCHYDVMWRCKSLNNARMIAMTVKDVPTGEKCIYELQGFCKVLKSIKKSKI